jgi:hypothetical protein
MADRDSAVGFESLKSRFLDGRISREAFLEAATALGHGRDAYAWLNTPDTGLAAGVSPPAEPAPPPEPDAAADLGAHAEVVTFTPRREQYA